MDTSKKKELLAQWKERHPEMGVISIQCTATGEQFLDTSRDTATGFNRHRFQLAGNLHRNKDLQKLWNSYGEAGFVYSVVSVLDYEKDEDVKAEDLDELLELCLLELPSARRV